MLLVVFVSLKQFLKRVWSREGGELGSESSWGKGKHDYNLLHEKIFQLKKAFQKN